jgi:hypothetical protein
VIRALSTKRTIRLCQTLPAFVITCQKQVSKTIASRSKLSLLDSLSFSIPCSLSNLFRTSVRTFFFILHFPAVFRANSSADDGSVSLEPPEVLPQSQSSASVVPVVTPSPTTLPRLSRQKHQRLPTPLLSPFSVCSKTSFFAAPLLDSTTKNTFNNEVQTDPIPVGTVRPLSALRSSRPMSSFGRRFNVRLYRQDSRHHSF